MPNDVKFGLVVAVSVVVTVAVVYARREAPAVAPAVAAGAHATPAVGPLAPPSREPDAAPAPPAKAAANERRSHTVQDGETLVSLAQRYYGDRDKSTVLFRANRDRLRAPDHVPPGVVLHIPDLATYVLPTEAEGN